MATARVRSSNRIWVWVASAVVVCAVFYAAHYATRTILTVRAFTVERGSIQTTLSTNGKMQPVLNFEAHAPYAGAIKTLTVHEGDHVPAGQLLLSMDDADARARLQTAQAALAGAEANAGSLNQGGTREERLQLSSDTTHAQTELDQAKRSLATLQKLASSGAAAPNEVIAAQNRVASDTSSLEVLDSRKGGRYDAADLNHARLTVDEAKAAVVAAESTLRNANVHAPFAGTVYSVPSLVTEYVQQGDRLLEMADLSKMEVIAYFDEPDLGKLHVGEAVVITWIAKPESVWHGHISRLPATVTTYTTRNVGQTICTIDDPNGQLLPNTNVNVTVTTSDVQNALYVPRDAVHTEQGLSYVYTVAHGSLKRVKVVTGSLNTNVVEIRSGLNPGDVVALNSTNMQTLTDGVPVQIVH